MNNTRNLGGYRSKRDLVVDFVIGEIKKGRLLTGEHLRQDALAQQVGVSSTPVREALRQLEALGVLVHAPNKNVSVAHIGTEDA